MGWQIVEYAEKMSAVKKRPVLEKLMEDARLKRFDVVMVWKLDRFGRSMGHLVGNVRLLDSYGVRFMALTQGIDTDVRNPLSKFLMNVLAAFAEFEREIIIDRVNAGLAAARARGVVGGRPRRVFSRPEAIRLKRSGLGVRAIAEKLGVSKSLVANVLKGVH